MSLAQIIMACIGMPEKVVRYANGPANRPNIPVERTSPIIIDGVTYQIEMGLDHASLIGNGRTVAISLGGDVDPRSWYLEPTTEREKQACKNDDFSKLVCVTRAKSW